MYKRVGSLVQYGLLATLIIYGLITHWSVPQIYTFISIIVLGIVLGLLFLIYNVQSLTGEQKIGTHLGLSALAILIVALFNGWININWGQVFTWLLILSGLALLAYFGYQYYLNQKAKEPLEEETGAPTIDDDETTSNYYNETDSSNVNDLTSDYQEVIQDQEDLEESEVVVIEYDDLDEEAEEEGEFQPDFETRTTQVEEKQFPDPLPEEDLTHEPTQDQNNRVDLAEEDYDELNPEDPNYHG